MTVFSILALGFFLGMRHATDSDHVVAVTTIVSQRRKVGSAALTGIFWGIGHSITLLVVGTAIVLFGVAVPERLGMSLEFCVALMLVLLGLLNLVGSRRRLNEVHEHSHHHGFRDKPSAGSCRCRAWPRWLGSRCTSGSADDPETGLGPLLLIDSCSGNDCRNDVDHRDHRRADYIFGKPLPEF